MVLKILESYHSEFSKTEHFATNIYLSEFLPLALEFYNNHGNSSDLTLGNSLIRYLNVYFPNLDQSRFLVTKEEHVQYFNGQVLTMQNCISKKSTKKSKIYYKKSSVKICKVQESKLDLAIYS